MNSSSTTIDNIPMLTELERSVTQALTQPMARRLQCLLMRGAR